jgi:zinc protease
MHAVHRFAAAPLLVTLAACGGSAPPAAPAPASTAPAAADWERLLPPALPPTPVRFPDFHERTLANGARVIVVPDATQPVLTVSLLIGSGTAADPRDRIGVAELTAALLNKGTPSRDANRIAGAIDFVGGTLGASAGVDWTSVSVFSLAEFADTALALLADVVLNPTFPEQELATERTRLLSALQLQLSQPEPLAANHLARQIYGTHPYGKLPTPESIQAIARGDLANFHRLHFRPGNALFVVAGAVEPDAIVAVLERRFAGWSAGTARPPSFFEPPARTRREIHLLHKPGSVQAVVRAGHLLPPATHPDWTALTVANRILGAGPTSWLFQVLREQKGYTYGAYSATVRRTERGYFQAGAEVRNEVADSALAEFFTLLDRIRAAPVPERDLRLARDFLTGAFPLTIETPQQVASQVAENRMRGLPDEHLRTHRERVAAVTVEDVQRVAREHLQPDRSIVVIVGDANVLYEQVSAFGTVRLFDAEGRPMALSDLAVGGADLGLSAAGLAPMTLVYDVLVQGQRSGESTVSIRRESVDGQDAVRRVTTSRISTPMGSATQNEDVAVAAGDLTALRFQSSVQAGGRTVQTVLRHEDGRVTGTSTGPQGTHAVDAAVPRGTLFTGAELIALMVAPLAPGAELRLPVFAQGSAVNLTARVTGERRVRVPAGEFEVYEVELSGGPGGRPRLLLRRQAPHILVRQETSGQPIVVELTEIR